VFDVFCPRHGARVLLSAGNVENLRNTDRGIEVRFRCHCGYRGTWVTGRRAALSEPPHVRRAASDC
jgi:hypothetical protein